MQTDISAPVASTQPITPEVQEKFLHELRALSGQARCLDPAELPQALSEIVRGEDIRKATLWSDERLLQLGIATQLQRCGVELIPAGVGKRALAECDLGITAVDLAIAETGTIGLFASAENPRSVSLLPRVHLAVITKETRFVSLEQALQMVEQEPYLILISGPSRTADIELTLTLGVHGPQALVVWLLQTTEEDDNP